MVSNSPSLSHSRSHIRFNTQSKLAVCWFCSDVQKAAGAPHRGTGRPQSQRWETSVCGPTAVIAMVTRRCTARGAHLTLGVQIPWVPAGWGSGTLCSSPCFGCLQRRPPVLSPLPCTPREASRAVGTVTIARLALGRTARAPRALPLRACWLSGREWRGA